MIVPPVSPITGDERANGKPAPPLVGTDNIARAAGTTDPALPVAEFLNRELSWLEFNRRVLHEAKDARNPLLERVKFLEIFTSNLDEFFMKRVGGLAPADRGGSGVADRRRAYAVAAVGGDPQGGAADARGAGGHLQTPGAAGAHRKRDSSFGMGAVARSRPPGGSAIFPREYFSGADAARGRSGASVSVYLESFRFAGRGADAAGAQRADVCPGEGAGDVAALGARGQRRDGWPVPLCAAGGHHPQ